MSSASPSVLYRPFELAFRTQYAELRERSLAAGDMLPGTPGRLVLRTGTGYGYWYRGYYPVPGRSAEDIVGKEGDEAAVQAMRERIEFADWTARQVRDLRKLGYQVADKGVARVLVEIYNTRLFESGLVMVGTLAFMAWLNELGARAVAARTQDIDLARRQPLELASPVSFVDAMAATRLPFAPVPGMRSAAPSTSLKLLGAQGLRIDLLAPGSTLGGIVPLAELGWHAQTVPHYDYLLQDTRDAACLAGGHCVPIRLPAPERFMWHKLYSSASRSNNASKAQKDLVQAATLAAAMVEQDDSSLAESLSDVPTAMRRAAGTRVPALRRLLAAHPQALGEIEQLFPRA